MARVFSREGMKQQSYRGNDNETLLFTQRFASADEWLASGHCMARGETPARAEAA
jgi:hypothetical protein